MRSDDIEVEIDSKRFPEYEPIIGSSSSSKKKLMVTLLSLGVFALFGLGGYTLYQMENKEPTLNNANNAEDAAPEDAAPFTEPVQAGQSMIKRLGSASAAQTCSNSLAVGSHTLSSGRKFELYYRASLPSTKRNPAIIVFHGINASPEQVETKSHFHNEADNFDWIVVYPVGAGSFSAFNGKGCCDRDGPNDVQYAKDVITYLEEKMCFDGSRVFAAGFSNGGFMTHRLGCEAGLRSDGKPWIRAIAPHSGLIGEYGSIPSVDSYTGCSGGKTPILAFHGTEDNVVRFDGGNPNPLSPARWFSFEDTLKIWKKKNNCGTEQGLVSSSTQTTTCVTYSQCEIEWCTIRGLKHDWSGYANQNDLGATSEIVTFFKKYL